MQPQLILSSIGTSLLTNQINRRAESEATWFGKLRDTANDKVDQLPEETQEIIAELQQRAENQLSEGNVPLIRKASAELNGIYGFYDGQLPSSSPNMHWLIATDTAQGKATARIVEHFLQQQGLTAQIYTPNGLSMASTEAFSEGIDELLSWLDDATADYDHVCFNLVGGFKSFQAYLNTIGMFYAHEIIYIFEGENSELIRIPRLPIQIDLSQLQAHTVSLALMAAGAELPLEPFEGVPETLLIQWGDRATLSNWGRLIWDQSKRQLLAQELLSFPALRYTDSFSKDYDKKAIKPSEKTELQETLAKVSALLMQSNGNTASLADHGLNYTPYKGNHKGIDHFYVNDNRRVSCVRAEAGLELRHYGPHDYVNDNP